MRVVNNLKLMKQNCPICKSAQIISFYETEVPVLQNRVFDTREEAINSSKGTIDLAHCQKCNFTFNGSFDEGKLVYDEQYDNAVPSKIFTNYYRSICEYLYTKYNLEKGIVYDIGCGKGTFLKMLCDMYPTVTGIGIDPSYEGDLQPMANLNFIREFFSPGHVKERPSLLLSRHVFEHIGFPRDFLAIINEPIRSFEDVPIFIEVPDFQWIVNNKTFWDLCYEHCNYFSEKSMQEVFNNEWSVLHEITKSFGNQYLWVEGDLNPSRKDSQLPNISEVGTPEIKLFIDSINESKGNIHQLIVREKKKGSQIIIWGMATKGVIFSNCIDGENQLIDFCIDINKDKQGKYSPVSGHLIQSPEVLVKCQNKKLLIIVMNTNYLEEIQAQLSVFAEEAIFIDAHGHQL